MAPSPGLQGEALETRSDPVLRSKTPFAPQYDIPWVALVGIEHPCIIRNKDRGIQTLGGLQEFKKVSVYCCLDCLQAVHTT